MYLSLPYYIYFDNEIIKKNSINKLPNLDFIILHFSICEQKITKELSFICWFYFNFSSKKKQQNPAHSSYTLQLLLIKQTIIVVLL